MYYLFIIEVGLSVECQINFKINIYSVSDVSCYRTIPPACKLTQVPKTDKINQKIVLHPRFYGQGYCKTMPMKSWPEKLQQQQQERNVQAINFN